MGLGYTLAVLSMSFIREIISTGGFKISNPLNTSQVFVNVKFFSSTWTINMFSMPVGAFITFACLAAFVSWYKDHANKKEQAAAKEAK